MVPSCLKKKLRPCNILEIELSYNTISESLDEKSFTKMCLGVYILIRHDENIDEVNFD